MLFIVTDPFQGRKGTVPAWDQPLENTEFQKTLGLGVLRLWLAKTRPHGDRWVLAEKKKGTQ